MRMWSPTHICNLELRANSTLQREAHEVLDERNLRTSLALAPRVIPPAWVAPGRRRRIRARVGVVHVERLFQTTRFWTERQRDCTRMNA